MCENNPLFILLAIDTERTILAAWLASERWVYHSKPQLSQEEVLERIDQGEFTGTNCQTFWINAAHDRRVGLIRLFDLDDIDDGAPMFDFAAASSVSGDKVWARQRYAG